MPVIVSEPAPDQMYGWVTGQSDGLPHAPTRRRSAVSNHFTGLSLGPPLGDQRLDLCDLYAFQSPANPDRTVLILNANPNADALHPDAIYRLAVDNDGDLLNDIAFSYVFSEPRNGTQTVDVFMGTGQQARSAEAVGAKIFSGVDVSFGAEPNIVTAGEITFFAGARSDAFFFDFDGVKNLFDTSGKRNFTDLHSVSPHRGPAWTRTPRPTCSLPCWNCRPSDSAAIPASGYGAGAVCGATAALHTSTVPAIRRSQASSTPTTPRRSTTPANPSTIATAGWTSSST